METTKGVSPKQKGMKTKLPKTGQVKVEAYKQFKLQYNRDRRKCLYRIRKDGRGIDVGTVAGVMDATRLFDKLKAER